MTKTPPKTLPYRDHSDTEWDGDDAAAQGNDREGGQQDGKDEEALVESRDVDRGGTGDALRQCDHELSEDGALHHRAHLLQVEVGDLLAQRVELPDQRLYPFAVGQQRDEYVDEQHCRGHGAGQASYRTLQTPDGVLAALLRDGGHSLAEHVGGDVEAVEEGHPVDQFVDEFERLVAQRAEIGPRDPRRDAAHHCRDLRDREQNQQGQGNDYRTQRGQQSECHGHASAEPSLKEVEQRVEQEGEHGRHDDRREVAAQEVGGEPERDCGGDRQRAFLARAELGVHGHATILSGVAGR